MIQRHGDLATPEGIQRAADQAVHNEARLKFLHTEAKALETAMRVRADTGKTNARGQKQTYAVLPQAAREFAAGIIAKLRVRDLRPSQYTAAEVRAAKEAERAFMKGDLEKAAEEKRNQIINAYTAKEAMAAAGEIQQAVAYFRKFESAGEQLKTAMTQLYAARDDVQRDIADIEATRGKLWEAMQKLAGAAHFAQTLDSRLAEQVNALEATDPQRAQALRQEVLFYARQNLTDILTQQAVCVNGYLALDVLKKTGREMMNGCTRVATTGMSALAVAQTVARATGNQIQVMEMLQGVNATIGELISQTGRQLNQHVDATAQFASNPMIGIEKMQEMFDQTYKAMDAMDNFRAKAIDTMGRNNEIMRDQISKSERYVDRVRQQQARAVVSAPIDGPVKL
jgi:hypothetical protein